MTERACTLATFLSGLLLIGAHAAPAMGAIIEIDDGNSSAQIETGNVGLGNFDWRVDGLSHLCQQWFWYRVGDTGGETSIDSLNELLTDNFDDDGDGKKESLLVKYGDAAGLSRSKRRL